MIENRTKSLLCFPNLFIEVYVLFDQYFSHGESSYVHGPWINKLVLGQEMCHVQGQSTMTALGSNLRRPVTKPRR